MLEKIDYQRSGDKLEWIKVSGSLLREVEIIRRLPTLVTGTMDSYDDDDDYYYYIITNIHRRRLRVASGATAPGPALERDPRFRPKVVLMSLSSYILR
jgi:hypothetical protein